MSPSSFSNLGSTSYLSPFGHSGRLGEINEDVIFDRRHVLRERCIFGHQRCPAISITQFEERWSLEQSSSDPLGVDGDLMRICVVNNDFQFNDCIDSGLEDNNSHLNLLSPTLSPSLQCLVRNFAYSYSETDEFFQFTPIPSHPSSSLPSYCLTPPILGRRKIDAAFPISWCKNSSRRASLSDHNKENVPPRKWKGRRGGRISI